VAEVARRGSCVYFKAYANREDALTDLGVSADALEPIAPDHLPAVGAGRSLWLLTLRDTGRAMSQQNLDVVRGWYAAAVRGDLEAAADATDPDFEFIPPDRVLDAQP